MNSMRIIFTFAGYKSRKIEKKIRREMNNKNKMGDMLEMKRLKKNQEEGKEYQEENLYVSRNEKGQKKIMGGEDIDKQVIKQ